MNNNFDRLLKLAQKTKSTLVVYDREGEDHCVVLGIDEFEKMSGQISHLPEKKDYQTPAPDIQESAPDPDLESDEAVLEALNQKIAAWKASQPVPEPEVPELSTDSVQEAPKEPEQPVPAPISSDLSNQNSTKSSSWHRLGDVMANTLKPKMPEVRYEEIGEPEVALPIKRTDEIEGFSEPEPLDDEPLFLEEPIS